MAGDTHRSDELANRLRELLADPIQDLEQGLEQAINSTRTYRFEPVDRVSPITGEPMPSTCDEPG